MHVSALIARGTAYRVVSALLERPLSSASRICVVIASSRMRLAWEVLSKICKGLPIGSLRGPIGSPSRRDRRVAEGGGARPGAGTSWEAAGAGFRGRDSLAASCDGARGLRPVAGGGEGLERPGGGVPVQRMLPLLLHWAAKDTCRPRARGPAQRVPQKGEDVVAGLTAGLFDPAAGSTWNQAPTRAGKTLGKSRGAAWLYRPPRHPAMRLFEPRPTPVRHSKLPRGRFRSSG
jgi:hypothetical protein